MSLPPAVPWWQITAIRSYVVIELEWSETKEEKKKSWKNHKKSSTVPPPLSHLHCPTSTVPPPLSHTTIYLPLVCTEIIILLHVHPTPLDIILLWVWEVPGYSVIPENYIKTVAVVLLISTQHIGTFSRIKSGQKKGVDNIWNENPFEVRGHQPLWQGWKNKWQWRTHTVCSVIKIKVKTRNPPAFCSSAFTNITISMPI